MSAGFTLDDLTELLTTKVGWTNPGSVDPTATLTEVGLDSLAVLELQCVLEDGYATLLPEDELFDASLADVVASVNHNNTNTVTATAGG
ncbi:MAG: hypothetical protein QOJ32_2 [Frankiaceae bacterium]|jgi:acyl carrier protein|nr:hypothetical protein [Frankiaceae bacterium]